MNKPQRVKIETPIGSIESDSGNHFVDIISVLGFVVVFMLLKKIMSKYIKSTSQLPQKIIPTLFFDL